jgi:hypothetical protein
MVKSYMMTRQYSHSKMRCLLFPVGDTVDVASGLAGFVCPAVATDYINSPK